MKVFKALFIFFIFILILFIVACSSIKNPKLIDVDGFKIIDNKSDTLILISELSIYNPNRFSISSKDVSYDLFIDTLHVGKGNFANGLLLPKKDTTLISSSFVLKKTRLNSLINLKDSVSIKILGSTLIPYINKRHYFDLDYNINPNDLIYLLTNNIIKDVDVQITKVRIKKIDFKNIDLEITFGLDNKTKMECVVNQMNISVYKSNNYKELLGSSIIKDSFTIKPMSLNEFKLEVKVNTLKMGTAFLSNSLSNNNSLFIKVNSKLKYNNVEIPIKIKKRVDYNPVTLEILLK